MCKDTISRIQSSKFIARFPWFCLGYLLLNLALWGLDWLVQDDDRGPRLFNSQNLGMALLVSQSILVIGFVVISIGGLTLLLVMLASHSCGVIQRRIAINRLLLGLLCMAGIAVWIQLVWCNGLSSILYIFNSL